MSDMSDFVESFVEMVDEVLVPRLKEEFGLKIPIYRYKIIDRILYPKYKTVLFNWDVYDKAWTKLQYKIANMKNPNTILDKRLMKKLVEEVIKEMKAS